MKWTPWHVLTIVLEFGNAHFAHSHFRTQQQIMWIHKSTTPPGAATQNTLQIPIPQDQIFYVFHRRLQWDTEHRKTSTQMAIKKTSIFWILHGVYSKSSHDYRTPVTLLARNANHSDIAKSRLNHGLAETYCFCFDGTANFQHSFNRCKHTIWKHVFA